MKYPISLSQIRDSLTLSHDASNKRLYKVIYNKITGRDFDYEIFYQ